MAVLETGSGFNLHVHAIVYGHFVPQDQISRLWHELTGDSHVVWINQIRNPRQAVNYLLKYITKPPKLKNPEDLAHYLSILVGMRRVRTWGIFYGCSVAKKEECPCPLCAGKLHYHGTDYGRCIPAHAVFFEEVVSLKKDKVN